MPRFLVNSGAQRNQVFELRPGEYVVGRDKDATLQLPNVSVSRQHAKVTVTAAGVTLEDLESGNGTLVNGQPVQKHVLASGDEVRVGKFTLVFLSDAKKDEFHKGRCVKYLPPWEPRTASGEQAVETFMLSKDALLALQKQSHLVEDARIVLEKNPDRFWHPEDRPLTFGGEAAMVRPLGWYVWGTVAEVAWDGNRHVLAKKAWWVPVSVNDVAVDRRPLRKGDRIRIAGSVFRYDEG